MTKGRAFRMRDQDGDLTYTGYLAGKARGTEPLDDDGFGFGGCFAASFVIGRPTPRQVSSIPSARTVQRGAVHWKNRW